MTGTDPKIMRRVQRWYLVVQARRLVDAGYSKTMTAERLGISRRSITRWSGDDELWAAAAVAPDREAVGPPKRSPVRPLEVLADAANGQSRQEPPQKSGPSPGTPPSQRTRDHGHGQDHEGHGQDGHGGHGHDHAAQAPHRQAGHEHGPAAGQAAPAGSDTRLPGTDHGTGTTSPSPSPRPRDGGHVPARRARNRYDGLLGTSSGRALQHHQYDEDPLDVTAELALLRSQLERYVERADDSPCSQCGRGFEPDVEVVGGLVDKISKVVHRVEKIRASEAISRADFVRLMSELGRALSLYCTDEQAAKVTDHVLSIRV